jgi:hypothetical protein
MKMMKLNRKYQKGVETIHVVTLNNSRFQVCDTDWIIIKHNVTASEAAALIPDEYEPVGSWFDEADFTD